MSMKDADSDDDPDSPPAPLGYQVGYARPPEVTRFQKGQSGNPKGRPKGAKGVRTLVNTSLDEIIRVAENGRPRDMRKRQAILLAMIAKAIKGDVRAASLVVRLMEAHDPTPRGQEGLMAHEDWLELLR